MSNASVGKQPRTAFQVINDKLQEVNNNNKHLHRRLKNCVHQLRLPGDINMKCKGEDLAILKDAGDTGIIC